jgi:hypothetical protein
MQRLTWLATAKTRVGGTIGAADMFIASSQNLANKVLSLLVISARKEKRMMREKKHSD